MKALLVTISILFSSCSSYVQSIHRQIDNENAYKRQRYNQAMQRRGMTNQFGDKRPIANPVTLNGVPTANRNQNYYPPVQRNYQQSGKRRYSANDLVDNQGDGSLWSGKNSESYLFVNNNLKKQGDIVIVEVMKTLKTTIQDELKRNFPDPPKKKTAKKDDKEENAESTSAAPEAAESPDKVYDKISSSVVEQINQDYLLIRGRKEILYKKYKRYFEIQAVVSLRDITSRDTVSSDKLLEPKINVLRY